MSTRGPVSRAREDKRSATTGREPIHRRSCRHTRHERTRLPRPAAGSSWIGAARPHVEGPGSSQPSGVAAYGAPSEPLRTVLSFDVVDHRAASCGVSITPSITRGRSGFDVILETVEHALPVRAELCCLLRAVTTILRELELSAVIHAGEPVDERVVIVRLVGLSHHRAVVGDREHMRLVVDEHLALVLVGAAVVLAFPSYWGAYGPGRGDLGAVHVRGDLLRVSEGRPHPLGRSGDVDVSGRGEPSHTYHLQLYEPLI